MLTLAIDTSTDQGSIALGDGNQLLGVQEFQGSMRHSTTLFPALAELGLQNWPIQRIIVGLGPGSFSGIRVGLAAAQGVALAKVAQVFGICSAWSVAQQFPTVSSLGIFADARRGEYYCTVYAQRQICRTTYLLPRDQLANEIARYALAVSAEALPGLSQRAYPRAQDYLRLPVDSPDLVAGPVLEPIYLREPLAGTMTVERVSF